MAMLTASQRNALPDSDFALVTTDAQGNKQRDYPIPDVAHAANAMARAKQNASPSDYAKIRAAVCKRYPRLNVCTQGSSK